MNLIRYQYLLNHQHTTKERIVYVMGNKCQICGYNKCIKALEIHHINPLEKELIISGNLMNNSWIKISKELEKCILLCANCHREVHDNIKNYNLISSFNKQNSDEILNMILKRKIKKVYYCQSCKCIIKQNTKYCIKCSYISRRVFRPEREEFKNLIRLNSFVTLGKIFKVSDSAIIKWCKSYNLPSIRANIKKYSDLEWELL